MFLPRPPVSCVFWLLFLSCRFYCPPEAEERNYTHFSLCVRTVLADLLTLSVSLYAGGMFHWSVSWIVPWTSRVQSVFTFPQPRSLFISIQTHTDLPSPHPLLHQRLQCKHSRAVACLQACICAGHVVSRGFVFTWITAVFVCVCGQEEKHRHWSVNVITDYGTTPQSMLF